MLSAESMNPEVPLVAPLADFTRESPMISGGKGANLGELSRSGFDVPPGFVITTAAYDLLLRQTSAQHELNSALARLDAENAESVAGISSRLRALVQDLPIPEELSVQILSAYRHLKNPAVAVRSSATAEDLPGAAFAGQQETFLNVVGESELIRAIHLCWASLWSERAILYRAHQKVDQARVKLAVVVQEMVSADAAGVMFTADPVSGSRDELVIDANPGLGEAVVSGLVTPDHFVVAKRSRKMISQRVGRKELIVRAAAGGGTERIIPTEQAAADPSLPARAALQLAGLGLRIEHHYHAPQDIEWAWKHNGSHGRHFFVLQARPMTALPVPLKVSGPMRMVVPMLAEMWPVRPYPLDMTTFTGTVERAIGHLLVSLIGPSAPDPDDALKEEDGVVVSFEPPQMHPKPTMVFMPLLALWRTRRYDPRRWEDDPALADFVQRARELEARDLRALSWEQNIQVIHEALALLPQVMGLRERYLPWAAVDLGLLWLLLRLTGHGGEFGALISGVETKTSETNRALEALAAQVRADDSLRGLFARYDAADLKRQLDKTEAGADLLKSFDAFQKEYGYREAILAISQPAWKDEPSTVLGIVRVLVEGEPKRVSDADGWEHTRDRLLTSTALGNWPLRAPFSRWLANARLLFQIREDTHFYAPMVQPVLRHAALELGRRLAEAGALDAAGDIFNLRLDELEPLGKTWPPDEARVQEIRALVERRKAKRASLMDKPMVDPRLLMQAPAGDDDDNILLRGSSGSPGAVSGPVRIVHDSSEFGRLQPGDVLVAPVTNPAWTPLFQRAAAVVVDTGGAASHAAIVAREYGIPAVMGAVDGTTKLQDGQQVYVDGTRGLVLRSREAA